MHNVRTLLEKLAAAPDVLWAIVWVIGMAIVLGWDMVFLNVPALHRLMAALGNTALGGCLAVAVSLGMGWATGTGLYLLERRGKRRVYLACSFLLNIVRSVPQVIGVLVGYGVLTVCIERELLTSPGAVIASSALVLAVVLFLDIADLVRSRISLFAAMDFYPAMLCAGVKESRIMNMEILWKNSRAHLLQVMISLLGTAIFLQCSVDFIHSVGLSTDISTANFPVTLGGMLANLDSKQDILAIGTVFGDLRYVPQLFFRHLQGISTAFVLTFTLACIHQVATSFVRRKRL